MPFVKRLLSLFSAEQPAAPPATIPTMPEPLPLLSQSMNANNSVNSPGTPVAPFPNEATAEPLPDWLRDEDALRDEGALFGLSMARPDEKIAAIRAYFGQQTVSFQNRIGELTESIRELNGAIVQRQTRLDELHNRIAHLRDQQLQPDNLIWTVISLIFLAGLSVGLFYLIDESLHPVFTNRWIAVGVFLAGMFNGLARASFSSGEKTPLAGWKLMQEGGLPLASAGFVLAQVWQTQPAGQCTALFLFVFFAFWQGSKRLFDVLTLLNQDVKTITQKHSMAVDRQQNIPGWEAESERLNREIAVVRADKRTLTTALNRAETELTQLNARRDGLVNLFLSEFELARSLRDQQRESVLKSYKVV